MATDNGSPALKAEKKAEKAVTVSVNKPDEISPTVTVTIDAKKLTSDRPSSVVTFRFREAVVDFAASDVTVQNGTLTDFIYAGGNRYTAVFTATHGFSGTGSVEVGTGYTDLAGNPGTAARPRWWLSTRRLRRCCRRARSAPATAGTCQP